MGLVANGGESRASAARKEDPTAGMLQFQSLRENKTNYYSVVFPLFYFSVILGLLEHLAETGAYFKLLCEVYQPLVWLQLVVSGM